MSAAVSLLCFARAPIKFPLKKKIGYVLGAVYSTNEKTAKYDVGRQWSYSTNKKSLKIVLVAKEAIVE